MSNLKRFWLKLDVGWVIFVLCILGSAILRVSDLPGETVCYFKRFIGINCPGCGLTRGFISISHFQWAQAWHYNPLAYPIYIFMVTYIVRKTYRYFASR